MDVKMKLLLFAIDMIGPMAIGYACRYQNVIKENVFNKMILNNILVVCPVVSFLSFWVMPLSMEMIWIPFIGVFMAFVPGAVSYWRARHVYDNDLDRGSYVMAAMLSNLGAIGGVCVFLLYGEAGYAYQQIVVLMQYILMFLFCYPLAQIFYERAHGEKKAGMSLRSLIFSKNQIAVLGIMCGGLLQYSGVPRPEELNGVAAFFVHLGAWTGLMPVGYSVNFGEMKHYYKKMLDLCLTKFVLTPLLVFVLADILIDDVAMRNTLVVLACTPVAANAIVVDRLYRLNINIGVAAFIVTTLVFLAIVYPVVFCLMV